MNAAHTNRDVDWDFIIDTIREEKCVLLIGPELVKTENGQSFWRSFVKSQDIENDPDISSYYEHDELFLYKDIQAKIRGIFKLKAHFRKNPYRKEAYQNLAAIPFKLLVNASPDEFLTQTMSELNFAHHFEYFSRLKSGEDIPKPEVNAPLIYNLVGSLRDEESILLTHDDLFTFLVSALSEQKLPKIIMSEIFDARAFIFLGVNFEKWYVQLMLRLLHLHDDKQRYVRYATNQKYNADTISICQEQFRIELINKNVEEFIAELYRRCEEEGLLRKSELNLKSGSIPEQIQQLVAEDQIPEAIKTIQNFLNDKNDNDEFQMESILLTNRFNRLSKRVRRGVIKPDAAEMERNKVLHSLMALAKDVAIEYQNT